MAKTTATGRRSRNRAIRKVQRRARGTVEPTDGPPKLEVPKLRGDVSTWLEKAFGFSVEDTVIAAAVEEAKRLLAYRPGRKIVRFSKRLAEGPGAEDSLIQEFLTFYNWATTDRFTGAYSITFTGGHGLRFVAHEYGSPTKSSQGDALIALTLMLRERTTLPNVAIAALAWWCGVTDRLYSTRALEQALKRRS